MSAQIDIVLQKGNEGQAVGWLQEAKGFDPPDLSGRRLHR